jgi:hypothetical protein
LAAHQGAEATAEFRKILDHRGIVIIDPIGALAHLQLGRAYAMSGDKINARTACQEFLTLWKDADPRHPSVNIGIGDAPGRAGMIRRGAPRTYPNFHSAEFLNCNAASWPTIRQAAGHFRSLRRTDNKEPEVVPACSFPTGGDKQPMPKLVHSSHWASVFYRCPDQTIDVFYRLT